MPAGADHDRMAGLDCLRFLAAAAVLLSHFVKPAYLAGRPLEGWPAAVNPVTQYGSYGVHVFFVISGFVIAISAFDSTAGKFFASRFSRLIPTLAICAAITWAFVAGEGRHITLAQYAANLTLVPERLGYEYIDGVYWTLAYEGVFYFFVLLLLLTGRFRLLFLPALVGWLALCVIYTLGYFRDGLRVYFLAPYAPLFIMGMCLYLVMFRRSKVAWSIGAVALWCAIASEQSIITSRGDDGVPLMVGTILVILAPVLVWAFAKWQPRRGIALLLALGGASYPLYLLHQEIGKAIFHYWPVLANQWGVVLVIGLLIGVSLAIFIVDGRVRPLVRNALLRAIAWPTSKPAPETGSS